MDLAHRADRAGLQPFTGLAEPFAGMTVVAHLGHEAGLLGDAGHHAGLLDGVGHRLLDVNVLAGAEGGQGDRGVHVVGRGDHHRVDVFALVEEHAVVAVLLGLGERLEGAGGLDRIHVAKRNDILARHVAEHAAALAADADARDVELLAGRGHAASQNMAGDDVEGERGSANSLQEATTLHGWSTPHETSSDDPRD